ncbi:MAG: PIG-L family deacetylase [Bacteroidota bacterium]
MRNKKNIRRKFLKAGLATSIAATIPFESVLSKPKDKLKVLVAGGHPDDPETGCGGTIARYTAEGHEVVILYLTKGEAGIANKSHNEAATIRYKEALQACEILGAKSKFFGQIDGNTGITTEDYKKMEATLKEINPDIIFTHWPIDRHRDHRICSMLIYDAWVYTGEKQPLYYYEVMSGVQSMNFNPTDYVDISPVIAKKWKSCFIHKSQKIEEAYKDDHAKMEIFRGLEYQCDYAEAFVHVRQSPKGYLPS